ncbi:hypothetical protein [Salipaludibacillus daqingensis]|uniref:hypothetical protein n=1 Tax=Salipaludibacillus daqingensis TaxID=3041001 RepID=UPI00247442BD|nr:hypothetical protein [Salipaludibacillus daqingensis]
MEKIKNGGFSICFIGSDGAGKTTISEEIEKWLSLNNTCKKVYLGSNDQHLSMFKRSKEVISKVQKNKLSNKHNKNDKAFKDGKVNKIKVIKINKHKVFIRFLFTMFHAMDLLKLSKRSLKKLKEAQKYQQKGGIVIFDRFPQVQFKGIYDGPKIRDKYSQYSHITVIRKLADREENVLGKAKKYSPRLVFKLHLPPEVSISRKPDHSFDKIKRKAEITKELEFENSTIYNIDATQPYENELKEIKKLIMEELSRFK